MDEALINMKHALGFFTRFAFSFVNSMAFLPKEFGGAQEKTRPHFPAHHVGPLVDENRQIAIGLHPACVARADNCLARWPDHQRLGQRT